VIVVILNNDRFKFIVKIKGLPLFLHKTSNMFTTDIKQARKYIKNNSAKKWIQNKDDSSGEYNEYNFRFSGIEFIIVRIEE